MFFEDEKDIIRENADIRIDEDGTVTWEDVLNTDDDINLSSTPQATETKQKTIDMGDELQLVENEDDVNDEELMNILNGVQADSSKNISQEDSSIQEDFDIDSQLANVVLEQNSNEEPLTPRKEEEKKKTSSSMPLLMFLLAVAIIAGGIYYGYDYIKNNTGLNQVTQNEITPRPSVQEELNNTTQEEIEQRQIEQQQNIPVVNEEEANEIKPEEEKKEEKKQIIKVVPTGRSHPFMPIAKYAKSDIPDASILYDKSGIPKPPESYGIQEEETVQLMTIAVSGIMYDEVKPSAIITYDNNDYFVQKGDKLDNYRIIEIARNHVTIAHNNNTYRANIGEEFKVSTKFEGSAQFMSQKDGGGRQYYSVSAKSDSNTRNNNLRYVSEEDITINTK